MANKKTTKKVNVSQMMGVSTSKPSKGPTEAKRKGKRHVEKDSCDGSEEEHNVESEEDVYMSSSDDSPKSKRPKKNSAKSAQEKNLVLYTRYSKSKKKINVNCRIDHIRWLMSTFTGRRREIVQEMGFGSLLGLTDQAIHRDLAYWLMTRVNPKTGVLVAGDGREFTLSATQVQCILGIPMGRKPIPREIGDAANDMKESIVGWFGHIECGKAGISISLAESEVMSESLTFDETRFRMGLLIVLLGAFLCTTTNFSFLSSDLVPAIVHAWEHTNEYDWCQLVLDWLLQRVRLFQKKFNSDGYVMGCGGCTYFLSIFYLDRLSRPPVKWGEYPRINAWSDELVKNVASADKRSTDDYGRTKSVDVAYGENHPRAARDMYPIPSAPKGDEVEKRLGEICREIKSVRHAITRLSTIVEKGFDKFPPPQRLISQHITSAGAVIDDPNDHSVVNTSVQPPITKLPLAQQQQPPQVQTQQQPEPALAPKGSNIPPSDADNASRKVTAFYVKTRSRANTESEKLKSEDVAASVRMSQEKRVLAFIRRWANKKRNSKGDDPVMVVCDGKSARQSNCYSALLPTACLDSMYVSMASAMYNKRWAEKFEVGSLRLMLDPAFTIFLNKKKDVNLCQLGRSFPLFEKIEDISVVFVPIVTGEHWICLCFALKDKTIWIIDSLFPDPRTQHSNVIGRVIEAVDVLFSLRNEGWQTGVLRQWEQKVVPIVQQPDIKSCGILMLLCADSCADSFGSKEFNVGNIEKAREAMVIGDVLGPYNEMRESLLENMI